LGCIETSARKDINIEEIFLKLFLLAKLPTEMSPSLHHKVQPSYVGGGGGSGGGSGGGLGGSPGGGSLRGTSESTGGNSIRRRVTLRRRLSDACGAITPNVRRPSIRTDLLLLQTRQEGGGDGSDSSSAKRNTCVIQ